MEDQLEIALPLLRDSVPVKLLQQPQDPPSDQNLAAARAYCGQLRALRNEGGLDNASRPTQQEMIDAARYLAVMEDRIRETRGDPLQEILRVVNEMRQAQTEMRQEQTEMRQEQTEMRQTITEILNPIQANRDRDGVQLTLNIIPFADGSMPTQHPHNLPPLFTLAAMNGLERPQLDQYCQGYDIPATGQLGAIRGRLRRAVGMAN
ncbi:hypothetical protein V1507DRAFT_500365 [Lipomyces tetrasporus]